MKLIPEASPMISQAREQSRGFKWIIELLIFLLVFTIAGTLEEIPVGIGTCIWIGTTPGILAKINSALLGGSLSEATVAILEAMPEWLNLLSLFATALLTVTVVIYCVKLEKRSLSSMGLTKRNAVREYLIGTGIGILTISAAVGIGVLTGSYRITFSGVSIWAFGLYLLAYLIQGMSEEVLCRGYLMVSIGRKNPAWLAVLLSSVMFGLLHIANPGVTVLAIVNIALCGASYGIYALKRGSLWGACAMHSFWNLFQGNFFGISVSGTGISENSLLQTLPLAGKELWTGGEFGLESGLCGTIVEVATLLVVLFLLPSKK